MTQRTKDGLQEAAVAVVAAGFAFLAFMLIAG
jgi:hypothetical protein